MYQKSTVDEKWEIVKQNNRCRKCLRAHHTNSCKKNPTVPLAIIVPDATIAPYTMSVYLSKFRPRDRTLPSSNESQEARNHNVQGKKSVSAICPVQKVKIRGSKWKFYRSPSYARYWLKHEFHFKERCEETWHTRSQNALNDDLCSRPKEVGSIRVSRHNCCFKH